MSLRTVIMQRLIGALQFNHYTGDKIAWYVLSNSITVYPTRRGFLSCCFYFLVFYGCLYRCCFLYSSRKGSFLYSSGKDSHEKTRKWKLQVKTSTTRVITDLL